MNKFSIPIWTTVALLLAGPALADHCAPNIAAAQTALDNAAKVEPNVLDAVTALLPAALESCRLEEAHLTTAEFDSPMLAADYVSVGQSMLINVTALLGTN